MNNWCFITECKNNYTVGTGHIKRMIIFAKFVRQMNNNVNFIINNNKFAKELLKNHKFKYTVNNSLIQNRHSDIIFLDTYDKYICTDYRNYLAKKCKKLIIITDSYIDENIDADLVIYTNDFLKGKISKKNTLIGSKYLIMDSLFKKKKINFSSKVKNVLITFGGADPHDVTKLVLKAILKNKTDFNDINFNILIGKYYKNKKKLNNLIKTSNFRIFQNLQDIASFYQHHDYAITAGGNTFYELCSLGIPCSVVSQNYRQHYALKSLKNLISVDYIGMHNSLSQKIILKKIATSIVDKKKRIKNFKLCLKYYNKDVKKLIYNKVLC